MAVRLPPDMLARIDAVAARRAESRASSIRRLLADALSNGADDGVDRAQIRRMLALTPLQRIRHMVDVANGMARFRDRVRRADA